MSLLFFESLGEMFHIATTHGTFHVSARPCVNILDFFLDTFSPPLKIDD